MKKLLFLLPCLSLLVLAGCNTQNCDWNQCSVEDLIENNEEVEVNEEDNEQIDGLANPWTDCQAIEEAEEIAGFNVEYPTLDDLEKIEFRAMEGIIEIRYSGTGLPEGEYVVLRKGAGLDDISGDYNTYEITTDMVVNETINVEAKSHTEDTGIKLATWTNEWYSFSASFPKTSGVDESLLTVIVESLK